MSKRQVWVVERRGIGKRSWQVENVRVSTPKGKLRREWLGVDGASYRWRRYIPEKP